MAELVDALVSNTNAARRAGSIPALGTAIAKPFNRALGDFFSYHELKGKTTMATEHSFIRQFPELMEGKTILYVHGFGSSAQSGTVKRLRELLPSANVVAYDLPLDPHEAMALLREKVASDRPSLIIGTSMGGMYAEQLSGTDRILVNPAFEMADTMGSHGMIGKQTFLNPRADGVQEFIVTKAMVKEYRAVQEQCFTQCDAKDNGTVFGLFGDEDELVHTQPLFARHYDNAVWFHGGHRTNDHILMDAVVPVIRWIDDRQNGTQRPAIYVSIDALRDEYDKPRSSAQKAFRLLIEHYDPFVVAPAPAYDAETVGAVQSWAKSFVGVPAFGHLVFTNRRDLLLGDYLIDPTPCPDFMGTQIAFGSDTFKTWEDIITFFERLGGQ